MHDFHSCVLSLFYFFDFSSAFLRACHRNGRLCVLRYFVCAHCVHLFFLLSYDVNVNTQWNNIFLFVCVLVSVCAVLVVSVSMPVNFSGAFIPPSCVV